MATERGYATAPMTKKSGEHHSVFCYSFHSPFDEVLLPFYLMMIGHPILGHLIGEFFSVHLSWRSAAPFLRRVD